RDNLQRVNNGYCGTRVRGYSLRPAEERSIIRKSDYLLFNLVNLHPFLPIRNGCLVLNGRVGFSQSCSKPSPAVAITTSGLPNRGPGLPIWGGKVANSVRKMAILQTRVK